MRPTLAPPDASWEHPSESQLVLREKELHLTRMEIGWKSVKGKNQNSCTVDALQWAGGNAGSERLTGGAGLLSIQHSTEYKQAAVCRYEQQHVNADKQSYRY